MDVSSKTFEREASASFPLAGARNWLAALELPRSFRRYYVWFQLITAYLLLERTLWAPHFELRNQWALISIIAVVVFVAVDRPSLRQLGLGLPTSLGASLALSVTFVAAVAIIFAVELAGGEIPANATWPSVHSAWQYLIWALMQEFILQSFFFTRCEELFGGSAAVWIGATLFSVVHLPSPLLTTFTLIGGLLFCEMFRRYRSIYAIGIVHAALGLSVSLTMPDSLLHHMRVGIGYLRY